MFSQFQNLFFFFAAKVQWGSQIIWSPADIARLPTDKEMISL